jgi:flagellar operon protein
MNIKNNNFASTYPISGQLLPNNKSKSVNFETNASISFGDILEKTTSSASTELVFSKHANERLASRNIDLTDAQLQRLQEGAKLAQSKGIKESLVMLDDMAFIVNVRSNTVITAVNDNKDKIFTNIDGAVII